MDDMFSKIAELCESLSKFTNDELRENGVETIVVFSWNTEFDKMVLAKGKVEYILAAIGDTLTRLSKKMDMPLKELLDGIYQCETNIKHLKGGDDD